MIHSSLFLQQPPRAAWQAVSHPYTFVDLCPMQCEEPKPRERRREYTQTTQLAGRRVRKNSGLNYSEPESAEPVWETLRVVLAAAAESPGRLLEAENPGLSPTDSEPAFLLRPPEPGL